jgi:hypothetical protein
MKIRAYSPRTGNLLQDDITGLNYGNIQKGKHGAIPVVIRPLKTTEDTFDEIKLFLQNNGGYNQSQFGYLISDEFVANVRSYTSDSIISDGIYISDHFTLNPLATGLGGVSVSVDGYGNGDYVWLDVQVGALETGSTTNINYRFTFEYF